MSSAVFKRWEAKAIEGRPTQAGYSFRCPGCKERHQIGTEGTEHRWSFNGDVVKPVVSPSILVRSVQTVQDERGEWTGEWVLDAEGQPLPLVCHSFIGSSGAAPGQIVFLSDYTHALAGQVVDLPAIEAAEVAS